MSKKKLLKILKNTSTWNDLEKALTDSQENINKLFEVFVKYYFLSAPSVKGDYKNAWLYDEIPNDIKKKLSLKPFKDYVSLLLENKKGEFTIVKCIFKTNYDGTNIDNEIKNINQLPTIVFTNIENLKINLSDKVSIIGKSALQELSKVSLASISSYLKSDPEASQKNFRQSIAIYKYSWKAIKLVWETNKNLTLVLGFLTLIAGILPAVMAYTGKLIIDSVIAAAKSGTQEDLWAAIGFLGLEAAVIVLLDGCRRGLNVFQSLLRALLGQKVNVLILEKALKLELSHFENSEFYDKMTRARREASSRPLSLVNRTFNIIQSIISLVAYGGLLINFSLWAVIVLILTAIPSFIAETRFAGQAFRLFSWRSPETREQMYLETLIAREDHAKEVKLYQLGKMMLDRYKEIFERLYAEDRNLTIKRGFWGYMLGLLSTVAFYGAYAWIVIETIKGLLSLGEMTMYLTVFRQGQATLSGMLSSIGGMYEDNLYLSGLYEFLEQEIPFSKGNKLTGLLKNEGIHFENVTFTYPGSSKQALKNVNLYIKPGEKLAIVGGNGSGKTTLIKLLTRLYEPDSGKILLDGQELKDWDINALHKRIGVIFQNFVHYQFTVGENIGVGDVDHADDEEKWESAAEKGMAMPFIQDLPGGFKTQLGNWFRGGQELSLGQWQKVALSRAFMRESADILVLDEPTSAMDAEAEVMIFEHFRALTQEQMVILISHRFSTVRMADKIAVMEKGEIKEYGTHNELLSANGRYAHLFTIQAAGYQ